MSSLSEWICVKQTPPPQNIPIIVYFNPASGLDEVAIAMLWYGTWADKAGRRFSYSVDDVTHWMPLPTPPNNQGNPND
jgi:hypothetical protein